jgi:ABC-type bacteriocin/lantibiotic exporter with double-glycine peptidase domain
MTAALLLAVAAGNVWLDVPFFAQEKDGCGSAAIAMVLEYWARNGGPAAPADPAAIQRLLYSPRDRGIRAADMERYFRGLGFRTFAFRAAWHDLEHHLALGRPLIAALQSGRDALHYVVVAGMDSGIVLVNDPARRKLAKVGRREFERRWKDRWTLLAVPQ